MFALVNLYGILNKHKPIKGINKMKNTIKELYKMASDHVALYGYVKYWQISEIAIDSDLTNEQVKTVLWDIGSNNTCEVSPTL